MNRKQGMRLQDGKRKRRTRRGRQRTGIKRAVLSLGVTSLLLVGWHTTSILAARENVVIADAKIQILGGLVEVPVNASPEAVGTSVPQSAQPENGTPRSLQNDVAAPEASADDWKLRLVNPWNKLPEDYNITLTTLSSGHQVDNRCYPDLQAMMDACRAEGLQPVICSSYRTWEKQQTLFNNQVNRYVNQGYSADAAYTEAAKSVAVPGTSEHQVGLAVDIVDINNQNLNESQEQTPVQQWMMQNSWKYGFILRFPSDKSETTGIIYEPWHYRYVGKDAAKEMYEQGICLEEYLEGLENAGNAQGTSPNGILS